jgi:septum formation protein
MRTSANRDNTRFILQRLYGKSQSESVLESPDMDSQGRPGIQLYLASNSPRRKQLLSLFGLEYKLLAAQVDESPLPGEAGAEYVERMARDKAMAASAEVEANGVIIAADTTVVAQAQPGGAGILGKPADRSEALAMLSGLRGQVHQVLTAITIRPAQGGRIVSDLCSTDVLMRNYSDEEMEAYVASGDPLDKAGAYAIQHAGFHPVEEVHGCYANVMGLPLCHLARNLLTLKIAPACSVPQACQTALGYRCPVYRLVLENAPALLFS